MSTQKAKYTTVWDGGFEVATDCRYDPDTRTVSDIECSDIGDEVEVLEKTF